MPGWERTEAAGGREKEREQGCYEDMRRTEISKEGGREREQEGESVPALSSVAAAATADGKARECLLLPQLGANQYSRSTFAATLPSVRFYRGGTI